MTAEFHDFGLRFLYPENWTLVRDADRSGPRSISVHSPQGAFWAVTVDSSPAEGLLDQVVESIRQEYEDVEVEPVERSLGTRMLRGVELRFYCLDLLVTAQVLECPACEQPMVFLLQGENRDFEDLVRVFDAISLSCLQHVSAAATDDR
jgi:hypothetical protein